MLFEYDSNNSGGSWWLSDKDWKALEKAGWEVAWCKDEKDGFISSMVAKDGRWLGALARRAQKDFPDLKSCVQEWERITKKKATEEGCNCCGAPHSFHWGRAVTGVDDRSLEYGYASGEGLIPHLFGANAPTSLREALEKQPPPSEGKGAA